MGGGGWRPGKASGLEDVRLDGVRVAGEGEMAARLGDEIATGRRWGRWRMGAEL